MAKYNDHFDLASWTDFVRGHAEPELANAIESHIECACESCRRTAILFRAVADHAVREATVGPPERDVRMAKSLFRTFRKPERESFRLHFARLVAFNRPMLAGVRGCAPAASHYIFEDGAAAMDVRIETATTSREVSVVGQVLAIPDTPYC